jgi:hypothetical protein
VEYKLDTLIDKVIEKVSSLEEDIFITFTDKSTLHIEAMPGSEVNLFYNNDEAQPIKNAPLLFSMKS